jgi:hypothetical protein
LYQAGERSDVHGSLGTLILLVTLIHVAALVVWIWIRVGRTETRSAAAATIPPCAVCGAPSTHRSYDGLDPDARRDPSTGRYWSADLTHYPPLCEAH